MEGIRTASLAATVTPDGRSRPPSRPPRTHRSAGCPPPSAPRWPDSADPSRVREARPSTPGRPASPPCARSRAGSRWRARPAGRRAPDAAVPPRWPCRARPRGAPRGAARRRRRRRARVPGIEALLDQDAADGAGSGGVDDLDDARRGLQRVQPEWLADPEPDRLLRSLRVEPQPSPEEVVGIQVPGHQIGVRDRRLRPPRP